MEVWDQEFVDLEGPGYFKFKADSFGSFHFGAVEGDIDFRIVGEAPDSRVEFSWEGGDDSDPASGRGWAVLNGETLEGRIFIHRGDDSWFKAKKR